MRTKSGANSSASVFSDSSIRLSPPWCLHRHVLLVGEEIVDVRDRNQPQLFAEARADLVAPVLDARRLRDLHEPARRNARRVPQRVRELLLAHGLEQVADRLGLECFDGVLVVGGREDHGRRIFERVDVARDLDAGKARHAHVEQHHVRAQLAAAAQRFLAVAGLGDDFAVFDLGEQPAQPFARGRLVIDDQELHGELHAESDFASATER